jgi:hypothetical protein
MKKNSQALPSGQPMAAAHIKQNQREAQCFSYCSKMKLSVMPAM